MWKFKALKYLFCLFGIIYILVCLAFVDLQTRRYYEKEIEDNNKIIYEMIGGV